MLVKLLFVKFDIPVERGYHFGTFERNTGAVCLTHLLVELRNKFIP